MKLELVNMQFIKFVFVWIFGLAVGYAIHAVEVTKNKKEVEIVSSPVTLKPTTAPLIVDSNDLPPSYRSVIMYPNPLNRDETLGMIFVSYEPLPIGLISCYNQSNRLRSFPPLHNNQCMYLGGFVKDPSGKIIGQRIVYGSPPLISNNKHK